MATRSPAEYGVGHLEDLVQVGGSPRATISLVRAAKAHAFLPQADIEIRLDILTPGRSIEIFANSQTGSECLKTLQN